MTPTLVELRSTLSGGGGPREILFVHGIRNGVWVPSVAHWSNPIDSLPHRSFVATAAT